MLQITEQRDYILHLATTPKMEHDDPDGFKITKEETLDTVDESWIVTHAKQVSRWFYSCILFKLSLLCCWIIFKIQIREATLYKSFYEDM